MIRWHPIEVTAAPAGQVTLSECNAYLRLRSNGPDYDTAQPLLDVLRVAVPVEYEQRLNRALYVQQRRATAIVSYDLLERVTLEPHATVGVTVQSGEALDSLSDVESTYVDSGTEIIFDTPLYAGKLLFVTFTYTCGWAILPRPIQEAMLDEIQRRYERQQQRVNKDGNVITNIRAATGCLPVAARAYRVTHDPVPLVSVG